MRSWSPNIISRTPQGWASLLVTVVVMGGLQLMVLGIMGEYLGRIHEQTRGRPMFIVDAVVRSNDAVPPQT